MVLNERICAGRILIGRLEISVGLSWVDAGHAFSENAVVLFVFLVYATKLRDFHDSHCISESAVPKIALLSIPFRNTIGQHWKIIRMSILDICCGCSHQACVFSLHIANIYIYIHIYIYTYIYIYHKYIPDIKGQHR